MTRRLLCGVWLVALAAGGLGCGAERGTIGALIAQTSDRRLVLREVRPELASGQAGLRPGDEILLIDGRDVRELDERGVHRALGGGVGEPVKVTVVRAGAILRVTLRRTLAPSRGAGGGEPRASQPPVPPPSGAS